MGANGFTISYKERFRMGNNNQTEKIDKNKKTKKNQTSINPFNLPKQKILKNISIILRW